jgi:hypothetical protein
VWYALLTPSCQPNCSVQTLVDEVIRQTQQIGRGQITTTEELFKTFTNENSLNCVFLLRHIKVLTTITNRHFALHLRLSMNKSELCSQLAGAWAALQRVFREGKGAVSGPANPMTQPPAVDALDPDSVGFNLRASQNPFYPTKALVAVLRLHCYRGLSGQTYRTEVKFDKVRPALAAATNQLHRHLMSL